jgi:hypothetical protein
MVIKSLLAAAAISGAVALGSAGAAQADPNVSIGFGFDLGAPAYDSWDGGDGYYDSGYQGDAPWRYRHHHRHWEDQAPYQISCAQGRNIVASAGFHGVSAYGCQAPVYRYIAWKHGEQFRIAVNFRGNIVAVNPVY